MRGFAIATLLVSVVLLPLLSTGCRIASGQIPNVVSEDEYAVYAAWLRNRFAKDPPKRLLLATRTFSFDAIERCPALQKGAQVDHLLLEQFHALGEAEYPVHTEKFDRGPFKIPLAYEDVIGSFNPQPAGAFRLSDFHGWHSTGSTRAGCLR